MVEGLQDRLIIRELIENWVLWRDARMWDKFRAIHLALTCRAGAFIEAPNPDVTSSAVDGVGSLGKTVYHSET